MRKKTKAMETYQNEADLAPEAKGEIKVPLAITVMLALDAASVVAGAATIWYQQRQLETERGEKMEIMIKDLRGQISVLKNRIEEKQNNSVISQKNISTAKITSSDSFEEYLNKKDYVNIQNLMADRVMYVVDSSDCCGEISKKEAVSNMKNYLKSATSFDFSQDQQVVKQMKVNLPGTFGKYTIGVADNKMVLSYHLNSDQKVDDIFISASHLMYDLE
jgi:hypothetical protein